MKGFENGGYIYIPSLFPHAPNVKIKERRGSILSLFRSSSALPVKFSLFFFFFSENSSPHPRLLQTITHTRRCVVFPFFPTFDSSLDNPSSLSLSPSLSRSFSRFSSAVCTLRGTTLARVTNPRFFRSFFPTRNIQFLGCSVCACASRPWYKHRGTKGTDGEERAGFEGKKKWLKICKPT